jgi:hypothetical protein
MRNTHQEHFEDFILTGDFGALNAILGEYSLSTKIDGSPAIVFGTNPVNQKFFVSTKSAFNKVKIKLCHSHEEIDLHFQNQVASILHDCLDYLPRTKSIFQCDYIGSGGSDSYQPNAILYQFPEIIHQQLIVCVHTQWETQTELKDAYVIGKAPQFESDDEVYFVNHSAYQIAERDDFTEVIGFIKQMATTVTFATEKEAKEIKKQINSCIRENRDIVPEDFENPDLISLWKLAESIKLDFLHFCRASFAPDAYLNGERTNHEGFVLQNEEVIVKFVNRRIFSYQNFKINQS